VLPTHAEGSGHVGAVVAGRYELREWIGSGATGSVYRAHDLVTPREVAVKVFLAGALGGAADPRAEAALLRLLRLPGVVRLFEDGVDPVGPYLVMELVVGEPFPGRPGPLPWADLEDVALALLETLERIHWAGIVHRDLKPSNVLVTAQGAPVVLDLGISRAARATTAASRVGTPRYMAPESLREGVFDRRADLYALGVLLRDALTGPAVDGRDAWAAADVPARVREVVEALGSADPAGRPASAAEALTALSDAHARLRRHEGLLQEPASPGSPPTAADLARWFHGHERIHHIPGDAAALLLEQADATPEALLARLDAWERAGLGRWDGERFAIDRGGLERARRLGAPPRRPLPGRGTPDLAPLALRVLLALNLALRPLGDDDLARVVEADAVEVARHLAALAEEDLVEAVDDGMWSSQRIVDAAYGVLASEGPGLRLRLAQLLEPGAPQRLVLLAGAGQHALLAREADALGRRALTEGDIVTSTWAAHEGLRALASRPDPALQARLLEVRLASAVHQGTRDAAQDTLHHIQRAPRGPRVDMLERLARGFSAALEGDLRRGLELAPTLAEAVTDLERRLTASVRLFSVRGHAGPAAEAELAAVEEAARLGPASLWGAVFSARAWAAYRAGRSREAALGHARAARRAPLLATRAMSLNNAAAALLEAGDLQRAARLARRALRFASRVRLARLEAHAEATLRAIAYRAEEPLVPDEELVAAVEALGAPSLLGQVAQLEAAIAWRQGDVVRGLALATKAWEALQGPSEMWRTLMPEALIALLGPRPGPEALDALLQRADVPDARAAVQTAGLLAYLPGPHVEAARALARRRAQELRVPAHLRLEILSIRESLQ
jgi:hypothetical protein